MMYTISHLLPAQCRDNRSEYYFHVYTAPSYKQREKIHNDACYCYLNYLI